jgi:hypothetical protein
MNMSAGTVRLNLPRASVNPSFWAGSGVSARPADRQSVEVVESTSSAVARAASRLARWFSLVLRPLLGAFLLASSLFVVQASSVVPGFAPQTALACGTDANVSISDIWKSSNTANASWSNTRTVDWYATFANCAWIYGWHAASVDGGVTWYATPGTTNYSGRVTPNHSWTAGADGHATSLLSSVPAYRSCVYAATVASDGHITTWNQPNGAGNTCSPNINWSGGIFDNDLIIDTAGPGTPSVTYPTSTLYTTLTGGTVTWSAVGDTYSGTQGYYVNYHWATLSNGSCVSQGGDSGWLWYGNATSWGPGWGSNTCFQFQVVAKDNLDNWGGASGWSAWIESDQIAPTNPATTLSVGAAAYTNSTSITSNWSVSDGGSGVNGVGHYRTSLPTSNGTGGCTGAQTGWFAISGAASGAYSNTGLVNGSCYLWATDVNDRAGNTNYQTQGAAGATRWVMIDTSAPSIGTPSPSSLYANAATNVSGWNVNWSAASDASSGVASVTLTEFAAAFSGGVCGTWSVAWTTGNLGAGTTAYNGISGGSNSTCYAYKTNTTDRAGNTFTSPLGGTILIDTVAPSSPVTTGTGTGVYQSGSTYFIRTAVAGTMNLSSTATDATSGMQGIYYGGGAAPAGWTYVYKWGVGSNPYTNTISWVANPAGSWGTMPGVQSVDKAGNNGPAPYLTITPDNTGPTGTSLALSAGTSGVWQNAASVTVTASGAADAGSGLPASPYTWALTGATTGSGSGAVTSAITIEGTTTVTFTSTDRVGNTTTTVVTVQLDRTAPTSVLDLASTLDPTGPHNPDWWRATVTATLNETDATSGIGPIYYRVCNVEACLNQNDSPAWTAWTAAVSSSSFLVQGDGTHQVQHYALDQAGNRETTPPPTTIKIDSTPPMADFSLTGQVSANVHGIATASDTGSGLDTISWALDGGYNWTRAITLPWATGYDHYMDLLDSWAGVYTVIIRVADVAGNIAERSNVITVNGPIEMPEISASVTIVNCSDPTDIIAVNTSGTIYWTVDQSLCVIPGASLKGGTDLTEPANPLSPRLGTETSYQMLAQPDTAMQLITDNLPGGQDPAADGPLVTLPAGGFWKLNVTRENEATPIVVPYQANYNLGWYKGNETTPWPYPHPGQSLTLTPYLTFQIIALNHGVTP